MRKLLFVLSFALGVLCLSEHKAGAQYRSGDTAQGVSYLTLSGASVFEGENELSKEQLQDFLSDVNGVDCSRRFLNARAGYRTGMGLTISGASVFLVGGTVYLTGLCVAVLGGAESILFFPLSGQLGGNPGVEIAQKGLNLVQVGGYAVLGSLALVAAGVPTLYVCKNRMYDIINDYNDANSSRTYSLTFGPQHHGVGLALNF